MNAPFSFARRIAPGLALIVCLADLAGCGSVSVNQASSQGTGGGGSGSTSSATTGSGGAGGAAVGPGPCTKLVQSGDLRVLPALPGTLSFSASMRSELTIAVTDEQGEVIASAPLNGVGGAWTVGVAFDAKARMALVATALSVGSSEGGPQNAMHVTRFSCQ